MFGQISTEFLNNLGYDGIAHPREGIGPLLVLIRGDTEELVSWGPLDHLTQNAEVPLPEIQRDVRATDVSGGTTRRLDTGAGIKVLDGLLSAMGITGLGGALGYLKADTIEFVYENVLIDQVYISDVSKYLSDAKAAIADKDKQLFDEEGGAFIVTATVKSNSLGIIVRDKGGHVIEFDAANIKRIFGVSANLDRTAKGTLKVSFQGSKYLCFGFKAWPIILGNAPEGKFEIDRGKSRRHYMLRKRTPRDLFMPGLAPKPTLLGKGILFEVK